jgi:hypothetical protein
MRPLSAICETVDGVFNLVGYFPIVSSFTGPVRSFLWAPLQVLVGLVSFPLILIIGIIALPLLTGASLKGWVNTLLFPLSLIANGLLNFVRGFVEAVPIAGNLVAFIYDRIRHGRQLIPYA